MLQEDWLDKVGGIINKRIAAYSAKEIRFNLMAIVKDKRAQWRARLLALGSDASAAHEKSALQERLAHADAVHEKWRVENERRRHNYVPFIFNALQVLAERDELRPLVDTAKARMRERAAQSAKA